MSGIDAEFFQWLVKVRRDFHMHPEIAFDEIRTSDKIQDTLESLGVQTSRLEGMTGVVGLIQGKSNGPCIALRADIDALPIQELNQVPYKSSHYRCMHACGHDANTTIMLGTARRLMEFGSARTLKGSVKLIFQPAEERGAGARAMIERGVLKNPKVDCILAGHMTPDLPVGHVGHFQSLGYASADRLALKIKGRGSHGARPEDGIDPIVAGAYFIAQIQTIVSRNIRPTNPAVISVGKLEAGDVSNVIPETAYMEGSVRALSDDVREQIFTRLQEITGGIEKGFGVTCDLDINEGVPCLVNDSETAEFLHDVSQAVLGRDCVRYLSPIMGSEDFSYFTRACPGAIMRFGCANAEKGLTFPLHSPYFDIDEKVLGIGVDIFTEAVVRYLKR